MTALRIESIAFARRHAAFVGLFAIAAGLRFVALGDLPAPAGDEGNWTMWALELHRGQPVVMPTEASYVSLVYPRMMAALFAVIGPSFAAARAVDAVAGLASVLAVYVAYASAGERRAGLAGACVLALHPWTIAWSRCAAVPYSVALACMMVGSLAFVRGLETRRPLVVGLGVVVVALGAHFSPLTVVAAIAAGLVACRREHHWVFRHPALYAAVLVALGLSFTRLHASIGVAAIVHPAARELPFLGKLARLAHLLLTGLAGEATLRHFGHAALRPALALVPAVLLAPLAYYAFRRSSFGAGAAARALGPISLVAGCVLLPALLAPARNWYVPDIDRERYLFAVLPGFALLVADRFRSDGTRAERLVAALVLGWLVLASGRLVVDAVRGGGPDRGAGVFEGGEAYRGFRATDAHRAPASVIADRLVRDLPLHSGVVLAESSFRPLAFELLRRVAPPADGHPAYFVSEAEYFPDPYTYTGELAFVVWSRDVFRGRPTAEAARRLNEDLRARMRRDCEGVHLVLLLRQPDGEGLVEVYRGTRADPPRR